MYTNVALSALSPPDSCAGHKLEVGAALFSERSLKRATPPIALTVRVPPSVPAAFSVIVSGH